GLVLADAGARVRAADRFSCITMITCLIFPMPAGTMYEPDGPPLTCSALPAGDDETAEDEDDEEDGDVADVQPATAARTALAMTAGHHSRRSSR
ncbi:MAG TPA: hypothetical protein VED20_07555, partial [Streptosporangiaceae bacterium]|nr:hypothetical protein [Streptosporangiaceae bacterium]